MAGHVFIARGDLLRLHCDAWLVPCDAGLHVTGGFRASLPPAARDHLERLRRGEAPRPSGWGRHGARVAPLDGGTGSPPEPRSYLVNVGGGSAAGVEWFCDGARQFVRAVAEERPMAPLTGRPKPLAALPLIGTGRGGGRAIKGGIVLALVGALHEAAAEHDIDVALVTNTGPAFAAAQNARRQFLDGTAASGGMAAWAELGIALQAEADRLAALAAAGRLVLFLGAGVSQGAGLPGWDGLLAALAERAGLDEAERVALARLHQLDRARIIQARLEHRGLALGPAVAERLIAERHSLAHALLAGLPVGEVVTLNYDQLFELAAAGAGREAAVLPYQAVAEHGRWLLKLHGCVTHPEDIVLTREDYLRYADRRAALVGIVQALLITRHMLFVGFSLADDNFQRTVDDVRKAVRGAAGPAAGEPFGTALLLEEDRLLEELWRGDLRFAAMADSGAGRGDAARRLEIFLDAVLAGAAHGASPLLAPAYDGVLTAEERELRGLVHELKARASDRLRRSAAWQPVAALLEQWGGHPNPAPGPW
ncbi:MAG: SIR2 family protein [Chloroflexi bacterium]|nr:SIR2 family protein [Chloroflexota bacterium]